MKKATIFSRNGGVFITSVVDSDTAKIIGQKMYGGFLIGSDSFWGKPREIVINLQDVAVVILEEMGSESE